MAEPLGDGESLFSPAETQHLRDIRQSRLWQTFEAALRWRRDELFGQETADPHVLMRAHGAITEISRWIDNGPAIVLSFERAERDAASQTEKPPHEREWDPGTRPSAAPGSPPSARPTSLSRRRRAPRLGRDVV